MPTAFPSLDQLEYQRRESAVNRFLADYEASAHRGVSYLLRRPREAAAVLSDVLQLPSLRVTTTSSSDGRAVRRELGRGHGLLRTPLHTVSAAITIPSDLAEYPAGAEMQTLRRKVRAAERRGVTWEYVSDETRKRDLIALADEHERNNPKALYKAESPSNGDLLEHELWLLARSATGVPLLLSVTPVDNGFGALRYFRTLTAGDDASAARYLMTQELVAHLHARGAHHLVDTTLSMHLSAGLRHFQRMVGFRLMRVEVADHPI